METEEGRERAKENAVVEGFLSPRSVPDFDLEEYCDKSGYEDYDSRVDFNKFRGKNAKRKGNLDLIVKAYRDISKGHQDDRTEHYSNRQTEYQLRAAGLMMLMGREKKAKELLKELSKLDFFGQGSARDVPWLRENYHTNRGMGLGGYAKQLLEKLSFSPEVGDEKNSSKEKEWQFVEKEYEQWRNYDLTWRIMDVNPRGGRLNSSHAESIRQVVQGEYELEELMQKAESPEERRRLKAQALLKIYSRSPEHCCDRQDINIARVTALISGGNTEVEGYIQEGKYLEAVQVCLKESRREEAVEIYQEAKVQLEPQGLLYGFYHLGKIAEILGEPEKGRNYHLLGFLVGELGRT